ncbi:hypothetical protein BH09BAC5_BH09BAC5_22750 [soil metagenome]
MKKFAFLPLFVFFVFISACGNPDNATKDIDWMIGKWHGTDLNTVIFTESWQHEGKGMIGFGCSMSPAGDTLFKENLKIDIVEGVPYYIVTIPPKKEPILFKMIQGDDHNAIFENRDHDFPQRISYLLKADNSLKVKLEGIEKGQPKIETLEFTRSTGNDLNFQIITNDSLPDTAPKPININIQ